MRVVASYPLITVARLAESRDFFVSGFSMQLVFEASWVAMLSSRGDGSISLGLMTSDHPSSPPGPELFQGQGMVLTMQVDDAAATHAHFVALGRPITHPVTVEPWGQRRFMVRDPSGVLVDVVEQIEPAPGFWDRGRGLSVL